jgi:hypothetical protein
MPGPATQAKTVLVRVARAPAGSVRTARALAVSVRTARAPAVSVRTARALAVFAPDQDRAASVPRDPGRNSNPTPRDASGNPIGPVRRETLDTAAGRVSPPAQE